MVEIENSLLPEFAPLSRPMVERLLEYDDDISSVLERVREVREDVFSYMDVSVRLSLENGDNRTFPSSEWILELLAAHTPQRQRNSIRSLEIWQDRNILQREQARGRWKLSSVAALLIVRIINTKHQRRWLPESISPDEPRWWCYGKTSMYAPGVAVPLPMRDDGPPRILWTPWKGRGWKSGREQICSGDIVTWWSGPFSNAGEMALWNFDYTEEISRSSIQASIATGQALRAVSERADLLLSSRVQKAIELAVKHAQDEVQNSMLAEAAHRILEQQAPLLNLAWKEQKERQG